MSRLRYISLLVSIALDPVSPGASVCFGLVAFVGSGTHGAVNRDGVGLVGFGFLALGPSLFLFLVPSQYVTSFRFEHCHDRIQTNRADRLVHFSACFRNASECLQALFRHDYTTGMGVRAFGFFEYSSGPSPSARSRTTISGDISPIHSRASEAFTQTCNENP